MAISKKTKMIFQGALLIGLGLFLGSIMTLSFCGIRLGIAVAGGAIAGAIAGAIVGGIGIVLCGTGIGIPAGVVFCVIGALISGGVALPFCISQEHAVPAYIYITLQIIGWIRVGQGIITKSDKTDKIGQSIK